jgi:hypothetical protein
LTAFWQDLELPMAGAVFQTWLPIVGGVVLLEST